MIARATWVAAGMLLCWGVANSAAAQTGSAGRVGSGRGAASNSLMQELSRGGVTLTGPEREIRHMPTRRWRDTAGLTDDQIERETVVLKAERGARVNALADFDQQLRASRRKLGTAPTAAQMKAFEYRRALIVYRVASENRELRIIGERLETLNRERARRRGAAETASVGAARDLANVRQVQAAVDLLLDYDAALQQILRRDPITEADVIYALGLLEEKQPIAEVLRTYFRLLEEETAEHAEALDSAAVPAP